MDPLTLKFLPEPSLESKGSRARYLLQSRARSVVTKRIHRKTKAQKQFSLWQGKHHDNQFNVLDDPYCACGERLVHDPTRTDFHCHCWSLEQSKPRHGKSRGAATPQSHQAHDGGCRNPSIGIGSQHSMDELRSLLFYRERTSIEWSGWHDHDFWTIFVQGVAQEYQALSQGLIALATAHEGLERNDTRLKSLSMLQARKSMAWVSQHCNAIPWPVWITHCIVVAELSALIHPQSYLRCLRVLHESLNSITADQHHLKPFVQRICGQHCQQMDPLPLLRKVVLAAPQPINLIPSFKSLSQARDYLERILHTVAFQIKNDLCASRHLLFWWVETFAQLRDHCDFLAWRILQAAYGMSVIQIDMLKSVMETDFDQYLDVYIEVANVYEAVLEVDAKHAQYRFNVDAGLVSLTAWAAKWCREPSTRARLISLLLSTHRNEGLYSSTTWGRAMEVVREIEEGDIHPKPSSCVHVPEESRIRLHSVHLDTRASLGRLEILRHPYTMPPRSVWMSFTPSDCVHFFVDDHERPSPEFRPDVCEGPGYFAFLESEEPVKYYTIHATTFQFVLPRV